MKLKRIFIAIYLKSILLPYDSNIKFYSATLYSTKNVEIKTSFYKKNALKNAKILLILTLIG